MKISGVLLVGLVLSGLFLAVPVLAGDLTIKIIAVNPLENKEREMDVKYYLPPELAPEDVIDSGPLKLDYDVDKGAYFVSEKIKFQPKESKTFQIKVKDIWTIDPVEVDMLKKQLKSNLTWVTNPEELTEATHVAESFITQLDFIAAQQLSYAQDVDRRIEQFRVYKKILETIKTQTYNIDNFGKDAKAIKESETAKTIKFVINVNNPQDTEEKTIQHKHYLPKEILPEQVMDSQGFEVRYDEMKEKSFLTKEEVFKPGEEKKYNVLIKDIWYFPKARVENTEKTAQEILKELEGSELHDSGKFLFDRIMLHTSQITASQQNPQASIQEHIGIFRVNSARYLEAKTDLDRLEKILAIVRAKKLEEMEGSTVKNVLQKLRALRGLAALSEAIFKKGISVTATWKIIMGTIAFIALFTTIHFFIWSKRSGKMGEELFGPEGIKVVPKPGAVPKDEDK